MQHLAYATYLTYWSDLKVVNARLSWLVERGKSLLHHFVYYILYGPYIIDARMLGIYF